MKTGEIWEYKFCNSPLKEFYPVLILKRYLGEDRWWVRDRDSGDELEARGNNIYKFYQKIG